MEKWTNRNIYILHKCLHTYKYTYTDSYKIKWVSGKPSKQYLAWCLQWNCFRLSNHINSLNSERPHKSFTAHISHGTRMMPSPSSHCCLAITEPTHTHTYTHNNSERDTIWSVRFLAQALCAKTLGVSEGQVAHSKPICPSKGATLYPQATYICWNQHSVYVWACQRYRAW